MTGGQNRKLKGLYTALPHPLCLCMQVPFFIPCPSQQQQMQSLRRSLGGYAYPLWELPLPLIAGLISTQAGSMCCFCASQALWSSEVSLTWAFSFTTLKEEWFPFPSTWFQLNTFIKNVTDNSWKKKEPILCPQLQSSRITQIGSQ